jgi:hypothetical protein
VDTVQSCAAEAAVFPMAVDGRAAPGEQELLWTVDRPVIGYIDRVNWRW